MRKAEEKKGMEENLIPKQREDSDYSSSSLTWEVFFEEVKRLGWIAAPMVAVNLSLFLLQVISMMMAGHLGELSLSSAAIAVSLSGVTGFSFLSKKDEDLNRVFVLNWSFVANSRTFLYEGKA
ncbi:hypothetical protein HS088_TW02G00896 [Tripterygium wilfordii]|uniref:Uncharacterized protein n=1 Tax=Tripterygium wilfordii TaxID=458696 RepID=A0A7J7DZY0_TRIWF|nr:hypothetical protein HS088_TW02G00896 [Tripterygium wilfordii]